MVRASPGTQRETLPCQPGIFYSTQLSLVHQGERKTVQSKQKREEFGTTRLALQQMLEDVLHTETLPAG